MHRFSTSTASSLAIYQCNIIAVSVREFTAKQQTSASGRLIEKSNKPYFHKQTEESAPYRVPGTTKIKYTNKHGRVFTFAMPTSTLTHPQIYRKPFTSEGWREIDTSFCDLGDLEDDLPSEVDDVLRSINEKRDKYDNIVADDSYQVNIINDKAELSDNGQNDELRNHTFSKYIEKENDYEIGTFAHINSTTLNANNSNNNRDTNAEKLKRPTSAFCKHKMQEEDDLQKLQTALIEFCKEYVLMDCSGFVNSRSVREKNTGPDYDMYDRALKRRRHWLAIRRRFEDVRHILFPTSMNRKCHISTNEPRLTVRKMLDALIWVEAASTFRIRNRREYDVAHDEEFNAINLHRELKVLSHYVREELKALREKSTATCLSEKQQEEVIHPLFNNLDKFIACASLCQKHNVPITSFFDNHCMKQSNAGSNSIHSANSAIVNSYRIRYDTIINKENSEEREQSGNNGKNSRNETKLEIIVVDNIYNFSSKCVTAYIPHLHSLNESIRIMHLISTSGSVEENVTFSKSDNSFQKTEITIHYKLMLSLAKLCSHDIYSATDALDNVDEKDLCTLMKFAVHLKECNSTVFNNKELLKQICQEKEVDNNHRTHHKDNETITDALTSKVTSTNYRAAMKHCILTLTQFMETVLTRCKRLLQESKRANTCIVNDDIDKDGDTMEYSANENSSSRQVSNSDNIDTHNIETTSLLHEQLSDLSVNDETFSSTWTGEYNDAKIKNRPRNYSHVALSTPLPLVSLQKYSEHSHPQALVHYKIGLRYAPGLRHVQLNAHCAAELAELVDRYESSTCSLPGSSTLATNMVQYMAHRVNFGKNTMSMTELIRLLPLLAKMMLTHSSPEIIFNRYDALFRACATSIGVEMQVEQSAETITQLLDGLASCHFVPSSFKQVESVVIRMALSNAFSLHQLGVLLSSFVKLVSHKMVSHTLQKYAAACALKTIDAFDSAENNDNGSNGIIHSNMKNKLTNEMLEALHVLRVLRYCHYSMYPEIAYELSESGVVLHAIESFTNNDNSSYADECKQEKTAQPESNNTCEEEKEESKQYDNSNNNDKKNKNTPRILESGSDLMLPWWSYCVIGVLLAESAIELAMNASTEEMQMNREREKLLASEATKMICVGLQHATSMQHNSFSTTHHVNNKNRYNEFYLPREESLWTEEISDVLIDVITCCAALGIQSCEAIQILIANVQTLHSCCTPFMAISVLESFHELKIDCEHLSHLYQKYIDEVMVKLSDRCKLCTTTGSSRTGAQALPEGDLQFIEQVATSSCVSVQARDRAAAILQKEVNRLASILYENDMCNTECDNGVANVYVSDDSDDGMPPGEHLTLQNKKRAFELHQKLMNYSNALKLYA